MVDVTKSNRVGSTGTGGGRLVVSVAVCGVDMKHPRPVVSVDVTLEGAESEEAEGFPVVERKS